MTKQPTLFESFNARALGPEQVGRGFIFSPTFVQVAARSNTVVLGPRGSGKTTLLKMLTLPALTNWRRRDKSKAAQRLVADMDFVSIYVPSDFTWYPDFRRPITAAPPKAIDDLLSYALFRNHVLLAVCETLGYLGRPDTLQEPSLRRFATEPDESKTDALCRDLASEWGLTVVVGGLYGLQKAVSRRIRDLQHLLTVTAIRSVSIDTLVENHRHLTSNFFDDLRAFADAFEHVYRRSMRWAACFDEVEIAPDPVKLPVWQAGRSFDPRFLIKLSASPYDAELSELLSPKMPLSGHDFEEVDLSVQSRSEIVRFSGQMFTGLCREFGVGRPNSEGLLGSSFYDDDFDPDSDVFDQPSAGVHLGVSVSKGRAGRLAPLGFYRRKFQSLANKDQTFASYLDVQSIDLSSMDSLPEFKKAALLRKIISPVVVRDEFLFDTSSNRDLPPSRDRRYKARKAVPTFYTGAHSLFAICEGNPRWLIGLLRPLVSEFSAASKGDGAKVISRIHQAKRIERSVTTLLTLLSTLRATPNGPTQAPSILDVVELLGDFCFDEVVGGPFKPEPILSFIVDRNVSDDVYSAIGRAINQGALAIVPDRTRSVQPMMSPGPGSIRGRRVRVSFLLAPRYRLPLVLGRAVDLSNVMQRRRGREIPDDAILRDLFSTEDGGS